MNVYCLVNLVKTLLKYIKHILQWGIGIGGGWEVWENNEPGTASK